MALTLFLDTYLLVDEADAMLAGSTTWEGASVAEKEFALRTATVMLDTDSVWLSTAVSPTQPLAFPRREFHYWDPRLSLLVTVPEGTVPLLLQRAVAEQALHLQTYPSAGRGYEATWDSITVGPISLSNSNASSDPGKVPPRPSAVRKLLQPLLAQSSRPGLAWWRAN